MASRGDLLLSSFAGSSARALAEADTQRPAGGSPLISPKDNLKITKLETFLVKPHYLFLKVHTNAGIVGLGEPYLEGRAKTSLVGVQEVEGYLIGKDPRHVVHHWQNLFHNTCYHDDLILTSVISGIDQALWDIKGKALGVPIYEMLGGPTRDRFRIYNVAMNVEEAKRQVAAGFTAVKTNPMFPRPGKYIETPANIQIVAEQMAEFRKELGNNIDIAMDFHGAISPAKAKVLIKALEAYQPAWIEDPVQCQNIDALVEVARSTHLPMCVGERLTTKWNIREIMEKRAAALLNPDMSHAGGISELFLYAGVAATYHVDIAPHVPVGPIALAAAIQLGASIPNFLMTEHRTLGEGYFKKPFILKDGYVDLPTAPGLGVQLDEEALADKIIHDYPRNPENFDVDDGSVVDR
jgi:galactonate dehydratase